MPTPQGQSIELLSLIFDNAMVILSGVFLSIFMLIISVLMFNGLRKLDLRHLFTSETTGEVSSTKFWTNIAYLVATVAFLAINIFAPGAAPLEMIWFIYLGVVASQASVSKMLSLKFGKASQEAAVK